MTAATKLQEAGHKLDDLYIGFQLIRWLPQEFQSTVQQIYRWKEDDFRVVKIEAELILEANRLQLMKQDLEKAENAYLSSFTSKKSKTLPGATAAAHGDPNGKKDYQKKKVEYSDKGVWVIDTAATSHFCNDKSLFLDLKPISNMKMSLATEDKSCPVEGIGTLRFLVPYKNLIGSLSFIAIRTRPDIMYAVNVLSQFQANPGIKHLNCLLRLLGYLKYTQEYELKRSKVKSLKLRCYSDSDFATNRDDRVSMGGFITFIDETPISWRTFKQKIRLSTMEAEYVSLTEAAKEFIRLKNVINNKSLNLELSENVMFCDNQAAISFSNSPVENYRTKHIDVRYHFLRNLIYDKGFQIKYIGTKK
ncbi:retrovirus-related Pol polyprotein from transposon TNT 1-94 [Trichonephila clavipes]|nr:retrovirus-related Pol polyprotein from transposon TNT 1-94 [Trichonephila clavipes]